MACVKNEVNQLQTTQRIKDANRKKHLKGRVKKKQIKKMQVIEQLSDDDTPIEKLKPIIRKKEIVPEKPKLRFV